MIRERLQAFTRAIHQGVDELMRSQSTVASAAERPVGAVLVTLLAAPTADPGMAMVRANTSVILPDESQENTIVEMAQKALDEYAKDPSAPSVIQVRIPMGH